VGGGNKLNYIKTIKQKIKCEQGFGMVEFIVMFVVAFPLGMLIPDIVLWGIAWIKAYNITNDTAQYLGELGGAYYDTILYLQQRFADTGLNPSQWDLVITQGPLQKGQQGVIAIKSSYTLTSVQPFLDITLPISTSSTFTSQVFIR
jgi:hypothetical protein